MQRDAEPDLRVRSRDGTEIACWTSGQGPPLVLVHGAPADHTRWAPLLPHLEPHVTVCAIDRRGRGASGDSPRYRLEREHEDVAAVVDAVAARTGTSVHLYGHSMGGVCAFGGAALTGSVDRLILYEGWPPTRSGRHALPAGVGERMESLLAAGRHEEIVELLFREVVGMPEEELRAFRRLPAWQARISAAPALPRELRALQGMVLDPAETARITAPTLLVMGSQSHDAAVSDIDAVAAALPAARILVLEGHQHVADVLAPDVFAGHLLAFLRETTAGHG